MFVHILKKRKSHANKLVTRRDCDSMFLSGYEVVAGTMTVGQFVMIQAYISQLAGPLAWLVPPLFFFLRVHAGRESCASSANKKVPY